MKKSPQKIFAIRQEKFVIFNDPFYKYEKKNHLKRNSKLTLAPIEVALAERIIPSPGQT